MSYGNILRRIGSVLGAVIATGGYFLDAKEIVLLGLDAWVWQTLGAAIFFGCTISLLEGLNKDESAQLPPAAPAIPAAPLVVRAATVPPEMAGPQGWERPRATAAQLLDREIRGLTLRLTDLIGDVCNPPRQAKISGTKFVDCNIEGPAVLHAGYDSSFRGCSFEGIDVLMGIGTQEKLYGVINLIDAHFTNCRFVHVSILGDHEQVEKWKRAIASEQVPATQRA